MYCIGRGSYDAPYGRNLRTRVVINSFRYGLLSYLNMCATIRSTVLPSATWSDGVGDEVNRRDWNRPHI